MAYSSDADLQKVKPAILEYGVAAWTDQRTEAERQINRAIDTRWYREAASDRGIDWRKTPFNPERIKKADVVRLSVLGTLVEVFTYLAKDGTEDAFAEEAAIFERKYRDELEAVLAAGIQYDWDADGTIESNEKGPAAVRRLVRG